MFTDERFSTGSTADKYGRGKATGGKGKGQNIDCLFELDEDGEGADGEELPSGAGRGKQSVKQPTSSKKPAAVPAAVGEAAPSKAGTSGEGVSAVPSKKEKRKAAAAAAAVAEPEEEEEAEEEEEESESGAESDLTEEASSDEDDNVDDDLYATGITQTYIR